MEGVSQEAIALAGHLQAQQARSSSSTTTASPSTGRCRSPTRSTRWRASRPPAGTPSRIDGHDPDAIAAAIDAALKSDRPTLIACKTTIGFGAPNKAGTSKAHGEPLGDEEIAGAREGARLGLRALRDPGRHPRRLARRPARAASRRARPGAAASPGSTPASAPSSSGASRGKRPAALGDGDRRAARRSSPPTSRRSPPARRASWRSTSSPSPMPELILGSADLTPSNNTKTKNLDRHHSPATTPAATSTTASASTAWPRP